LLLLAFNPEGRSSEELIDEAEHKIMQISEEGMKQGGPQEVNPLLSRALERIEHLFHSGGDITGMSTGFKDLDKMTSGMQPADLVIVAGRPSMGKTSFAMNLVEHAVLNQTKPIVVFSMEMPADQLIVRMLSSVGRIDQTRIRNGKLEQDDWPKLSAAVTKLKDVPLFIDDTPALTPTELRARARRLAREHGEIGMIMIDYLQLMQVAGRGEGRTAEISEISRNLKAIAKEFNCPMVALSQLNRSLEQRPNKRPQNSDLRESGAIEQDADVIMFIYRDEVYNEDSADKGIAEVIIGKQRNGPIGTCRLTFRGQFTRFDNLAFEGYSQQ
jgi:replicative DNA helicase